MTWYTIHYTCYRKPRTIKEAHLDNTARTFRDSVTFRSREEVDKFLVEVAPGIELFDLIGIDGGEYRVPSIFQGRTFDHSTDATILKKAY